MRTEYIGDGVYVNINDYGIVLLANDHKNPTDKITLDTPEIKSLLELLREYFPNLEQLQ